MAAKRPESDAEMAKTEVHRRLRRRRRWRKEGEWRIWDQRRQTREREGREEEGTLERHSKRRSSGREEKVVVAVRDLLLLLLLMMVFSCGLGKHDFISHEKCRELQLSDIWLIKSMAPRK